MSANWLMVTPRACSAGDSASAAPKRYEPGHHLERLPGGEDHDGDGDEAAALHHVLEPCVRVGRRELRAADAGEQPADHDREVLHELRLVPVGAQHLGALTGAPQRAGPSGCGTAATRSQGTRKYERYVSGSAWKKISPIHGMSESSGTCHCSNGVMISSTYAAPNNDVRPSARNSTTSPVASWFALRLSTKYACTRASAPPAAAPPSAPIHGLPVAALAA